MGWREVIGGAEPFAVVRGDCLATMREMPDGCVDAVVCDPPYALPGGFMGKSWDNFDGREDTGFGYWLAGFTDGEGCFMIKRQGRGSHSCAFQIKLRDDDRACLERIRRFVGHGRIAASKGRDGAKDQAALVIDTKEGCEVLVGLFRRFPLAAKKALDFEVWAEAVGEWCGRPRKLPGESREEHAASAAALKARLADVRAYAGIAWSGHPFQDWVRQWAKEALRVIKPGGHMIAFGGTKVYHRLASGIEDAGWEIRDCLVWMYGSGFPKGLDISKGIDAELGAEREVVGTRMATDPAKARPGFSGRTHSGDGAGSLKEIPITAPSSDEAKRYDGWSTALKPAWEPAILARKALDGTVVGTVLGHGTGGLNIGGCRIGGEGVAAHEAGGCDPERLGRWPANVILDEDAAVAVDEQMAERETGMAPLFPGAAPETQSRFFYCPKPAHSEKSVGELENNHPTVKPIDLMAWLCRMVTPPGGVVLDPFCGSGSTLCGAGQEGFRSIGCELGDDPDVPAVEIATQRAARSYRGWCR